MLRFLLALTLLAPAPAQAQDGERPTNVVLFVADGSGPASYTLARRVLDRPLALDPHLVGSVSTAASDREVTDSAAGATAFACGVVTYRGAVGVDADGRPCRTVLEVAEAQGMATGLVTTTALTDATPAAFAAHVLQRGDHSAIAEQMLAQGVEVLLGGGARWFMPAPGGLREDDRNLMDEARDAGYAVVTDPAALPDASAPLLGLFAPAVMAYEMDRDPEEEPSLVAMTEKALAVLREAPGGFFLLVETEGTDEAGHDNDPAALARETEQFDAAVAVALDFAEADGETLVVATSDHETGGLTLARPGADFWDPAVLRAVTQSHRMMRRRIEAGEAPEAVLRSAAGIADLTEAERARLESAETRRDWQSALSAVVSDRAGVAWSTFGHTAVDVGVYAFGPGSERLQGHRTSAELGVALLAMLGAAPAALDSPTPLPGWDE